MGVLWVAELEVSAEEDTITISGLVPGITADSRLAFRTDDFPGGLSDEIDCQASASLFLVPGPCGGDEAIVRPNQTIADTPEEELPAYIDFVRISTAVAGDTLAAIFHVRDLPFDIAQDVVGTDGDASKYGWSVSIDVDPGNESGHLGFDYQLSAAYPSQRRDNEGSESEPADGLLQAFVWERIPDGYRQLEEGVIVLSPRADTVTLIGDIPGITSDSRLVFDAFVARKDSDRILCQEAASVGGEETTSSSPEEGE